MHFDVASFLFFGIGWHRDFGGSPGGGGGGGIFSNSVSIYVDLTLSTD